MGALRCHEIQKDPTNGVLLKRPTTRVNRNNARQTGKEADFHRHCAAAWGCEGNRYDLSTLCNSRATHRKMFLMYKRVHHALLQASAEDFAHSRLLPSD